MSRKTMYIHCYFSSALYSKVYYFIHYFTHVPDVFQPHSRISYGDAADRHCFCSYTAIDYIFKCARETKSAERAAFAKNVDEREWMYIFNKQPMFSSLFYLDGKTTDCGTKTEFGLLMGFSLRIVLPFWIDALGPPDCTLHLILFGSERSVRCICCCHYYANSKVLKWGRMPIASHRSFFVWAF